MIGQSAKKTVKITEAEFLNQVMQLLHLLGWLVTHSRPGLNRRGKWSTPLQGDPGFPDVIAVRERVIVAELKVRSNKPTAEQSKWLAAFHAAGIENYLWYPEQWDEIVEVLARRVKKR